ncbi:hypothetical protein PFISCL1PPCAC_9706, partial [Pristionchus fissidentatus]
QVGYKTLMAEDWEQGVFTWPYCKGFAQSPKTKDCRPFQMVYDKNPSTVLLDHQGPKNCFEPHLMMNDYLEKFIKGYPGEIKTSLTWYSYLGHDSANEPFHADNDYRNFFERNREEFDDSFVFFMGDHGLRFGKVIKSSVGTRDVNNPMLMISVPKKLRSDKNLMSNLNANSDQLLTMYDIHATFIDVLESFNQPQKPDFSETKNTNLKGSSLLRPLPPGLRNCKTLPIPPQYCLCEVERETVQIDESFDGIGKVIADAINTQLLRLNGVEKMCAELVPDKVTEVLRVKESTDLYRVTVQMQPNGGFYQACLNADNRNFTLISPEIIRMDRYGSQADCIDNNEIRPFCYCEKKSQ